MGQASSRFKFAGFRRSAMGVRVARNGNNIAGCHGLDGCLRLACSGEDVSGSATESTDRSRRVLK